MGSVYFQTGDRHGAKLEGTTGLIEQVQRSLSTEQEFFQVSQNAPSIVVIGCATWSIKASNGSREMLDEFVANITQLVFVSTYNKEIISL